MRRTPGAEARGAALPPRLPAVGVLPRGNELYSPSHTLKPCPVRPQNVITFGDKVFKQRIKLKRGFRDPNPNED